MGTPRSREDLGRKLLDIKERLDEEKERRSELQGELRSVMKQLKDEFGVDSLEAAEEMAVTEEEALQKLDQSLQEQVRELEEAMSQYAGD